MKPLASGLKYLHSYRDRHGKLRHAFRRRGFKTVPLPGVPGSVELAQAYTDALAGVTATGFMRSPYRDLYPRNRYRRSRGNPILIPEGELVEVHEMPVLGDSPVGRRTVNGPLLANIIFGSWFMGGVGGAISFRSFFDQFLISIDCSLAYPQRAGRHPRNRAVFKRSIARSANRSGLKNNYWGPCRGWGGP